MIRLAVERPVSTFVGVLALLLVGVFSLLRLPVSLLPSVERPQLVAWVEAEGRSREELLHRVVEPLERRLFSLDGVRSIHGEIGDGFARIALETHWQTDADRLRIEAERRLAGLEPDAYDRVRVELRVGDLSPIVEVAVLAGSSAAARAAFTDQVLLPELARLEGAGRVEVLGKRPLRVVVRPRAAALAARGLTAADLESRLQGVGVPLPAGRVQDGGRVRPLVVREAMDSLEALRALRLEAGGGLATLGDVALVEIEEEDDGTWFRLDGQPGVLVQVFRAPGANAVALAQRVRERVEELGARLPTGLRLEVAGDRSGEVVTALGQLGLSALAGLLLGTLVLRALLGRWRPTLALAAVIPASIVISFAAFYLWNVSLDVVSLAGLALAAGMLVDNSIVVLEAIEAARERGEARPQVSGASGVSLALLAGFLTTAVVFLPLLYLQGLARAFFGVQAFAIVTSLLVSLLLSLTLTPALSGGKAGGETVKARRWSGGLGLYEGLLERVLRRPRTVLAVAALLLLAALPLAFHLPRELMPDGEPRQLQVSFRLPPALTAEEAHRRSEVVEAALPRAGDAAPLRRLAYREGEDDSEGFVVLTYAEPAASRRASEALGPALRRVPGVEPRVEPRTSAFVEAVERFGTEAEVLLTAGDEAAAAQRAAELAAHLRQAGFVPRRDGRRLPQPALELTWDAARLGRLGVSRDELARQVRAGLGRQDTGRIEMAGVEPEILLWPSLPEEVILLPVRPQGPAAQNGHRSVSPLGALASTADTLRPPRAERLDGRPVERLFLEVRGPAERRRLEAALEEFRQRLPGAGETVRLGGAAFELEQAFTQLRLAFVLSILLVFLTLAALYESLFLPLVVMSTVPVAAAGALAGLALTGQSLNLMSALGILLLTGIVVNNAIVLLHRIRESSGVRQAALERYRPILMTTLTTVFGMLPLALLGGDGVELRRALGVAVLGGLVTATAATLLLVPALYTTFSGRREERDS